MRTDYDETPYPSLSYSQTHPDRLATIATLLGLNPAPVTQCRVLELGSAAGGNLYPMAYALPRSQFTGIDFSQAQIDAGREVLDKLELQNVSLQRVDIMDITSSFGQFDYIIAHGVYSWVPPVVREKVMQVCRDNLSPNGIAYVSYNSYPGWHMMSAIREAMLYRTRDISDPSERVTQARALLDFMAEAIPGENNAFGAFLASYMRFLQGELKGASASGNAFLLHDELEEVNDPVYFWQFARHAAEHGLQYVAEAEIADVFPKGYSDEVMRKLQSLSHDIVELEQYLDFLRSRMFRQTLLCHADLTVRRTLALDRVRGMFVASRIKPVSENPSIDTITVEQFRSTDGATLSTDHPVSKAALLHLAQVWPRAISIGELLAAARARVNAAPDRMDDDAVDLMANLLKAYTYSSQLVELHTFQPPLVGTLSERPIASAIARFEARQGSIVANLWHERAHLTPLNRQLVRLLDGTRDRTAVLDSLVKLAIEEKIHLKVDGQPITEEGQMRQLLDRELDQNLQWLARAGTLVG